MASVWDVSLAFFLFALFGPDVEILFVAACLTLYAFNAASLSIFNFVCWSVSVCLRSASVGIIGVCFIGVVGGVGCKIGCKIGCGAGCGAGCVSRVGEA